MADYRLAKTYQAIYRYRFVNVFLIKLLRRLQNSGYVRKNLRRFQHKFDIRRAGCGDLNALSRWFAGKRQPIPGPKEYELQIVFIARFYGLLSGCIKLIYFGEKRSCMPGYWLYSLVVRFPFRGMGLGERLCSTAVQYAHEQGIDQLHLLVQTKNEIARQVYARVGFSENQALQVVIPVNQNLMVMSYDNQTTGGPDEQC